MEPLEDHLSLTSALTAVVGQAAGNVGAVLVIESPGSEDGESSILGGRQSLFNVLLVLEQVACVRGLQTRGRYVGPHSLH
jgi:hypothetical protein